MPREFVDVRCPDCRKLLCKAERDALQPGRAIELHCERCKKQVYQVGPPRAAEVTTGTT